MQCQVCGNHYENCFTVTLADETFVFDCFERAIHALAPSCAHCGCRIVGHGVSRSDEIFCCEHCARVAAAGDDAAYADDQDSEDDTEDDTEDEEDEDESDDDEFDDDLEDAELVDDDEFEDEEEEEAMQQSRHRHRRS